MDCPDDISFVMSFLKEFNYPLIHSMNFEEMANVFNISNRCFLVCWALKLLDEECYLDVLQDREHDKDLLGNLVSQHGFCTGNEKFGFFNGDMPTSEQVKILHRMFMFIKRLKCTTVIDNNVPGPVTVENLQTLINTNLNIFPTFGEIKILSEKEKLFAINKLQKEIEELEVLKEKNVLSEETNLTKMSAVNKSELRNTVEKLSENFYQFDRIIKDISIKKGCKVKSNYTVDPRSEELLMKCNKYLKVVSQYIEDLKIIKNFAMIDPEEPNDEISPLIEILAEQIHNSFRSI